MKTLNQALRARSALRAMIALKFNIPKDQRELLRSYTDMPKQTKLVLGAMTNRTLPQLQGDLGYPVRRRYSGVVTVAFPDNFVASAIHDTDEEFNAYIFKELGLSNIVDPLANFYQIVK